MSVTAVIDIEAILDPAVPPPTDPAEFAPAACWQIVCIGCLTFDGQLTPKKLDVFPGEDERSMLGRFASWLEQVHPTLVSWNGRGYDLPVIEARSLSHGLAMPWWFSDRNTRYRFSVDGHFDVKDYLSGFGACKVGTLDQVARLVGFPGKFGIDGSQVAEYVATGRLDVVRAYCLTDVAQTAAIYLRAQLLRGAIGRTVYLDAARKLLALIRDDQRTAGLHAKTDGTAFLLGEDPAFAVTQGELFGGAP